MPEVQRVHVDVPPEPEGPTRSYYDFRAEPGDHVKTLEDPGTPDHPEATFRWQLVGANGKLKLEAGNFESRADAEQAARSAHGDTPDYREDT